VLDNIMRTIVGLILLISIGYDASTMPPGGCGHGGAIDYPGACHGMPVTFIAILLMIGIWVAWMLIADKFQK
jgi:hypothetical protein